MTINPRIIAAMERGIAEMNATPAELSAMKRRSMLRSVMRRAWAIARLASEVFGGTASQYIAGALSQAWAEQRGECDPVNADSTFRRLQARVTRRTPASHRQTAWYGSAVGW